MGMLTNKLPQFLTGFIGKSIPSTKAKWKGYVVHKIEMKDISPLVLGIAYCLS